MSLKHAITFDAIRFSALLDEETYQERLASYLKRKCSNVSGTSGKLLEENVTTYQEHLASYLKKMLQRSRHVLHVT